MIEDVLVKVDKLIFPDDFAILDENTEVSIILDYPFLSQALIDVCAGN